MQVAVCTAESATLRWAAPDADGNAPINGYRVEFKAAGRRVYKFAARLDATTCEFELVELTPSTHYNARVAAFNQFGAGVYADVEFETPPLSAAPLKIEPPSVEQLSSNVSANLLAFKLSSSRFLAFTRTHSDVQTRMAGNSD